MNRNQPTAILLINCPDQNGIIARVTEFLSLNRGNIIDLDEHVDEHEKVFFMRVEWEMYGFLIPKDNIEQEFKKAIGIPFNMVWELYFTGNTPRMAILVSKYQHCLFDILSRYHAGEFEVEIPLIISNHPDLAELASKFDIPYYHIEINKANKAEQEQRQIELLKSSRIELVVLARYMQILSPEFIQTFENRIINIHHSFLPAFPGAKPYHSAYERGVKIIGASSHYVTSVLDEGPLIEQDVVRVSHKDAIQSLMRKGRDLEKIVLSRAIWNHLQRKVMVFKNRTIIFG